MDRTRGWWLALAMGLMVLAPISLPRGAQADETGDKKRADIVTLLELTGAVELGQSILAQLVDGFRQGFPDVPEARWKRMQASADLTALVDALIPIYDKNFTHPEIKDLIKFYRTKTGKKVLDVMPTVTEQALRAGQKWGQALGMKVLEELEAQEAEPPAK